VITPANAEWVLLSAIYHHVLAQSPSPEAAKIAISTARENGQLQLRAEVREHKAMPHLRLDRGEKPPESRPEIILEQPILPSDIFSHWDWARSCAQRSDPTTKSLFEYLNIVGHRDDVLQLWPEPGETTAVGTNSSPAEPIPSAATEPGQAGGIGALDHVAEIVDQRPEPQATESGLQLPASVKKRPQSKRAIIEGVLRDLFPQGVPDTVLHKELFIQVAKEMEKRRVLFEPKLDTILRAAGRRK
jgi:hypothetical protein